MKKLLFILSLCIAMNSFAGSLTIYNKSKDKMDVRLDSWHLNHFTSQAKFTLNPGTHKYFNGHIDKITWNKHGTFYKPQPLQRVLAQPDNRNLNLASVWSANVNMLAIQTFAEFTIREEDGLYNWKPWQGQARKTKLKATETGTVLVQ